MKIIIDTKKLQTTPYYAKHCLVTMEDIIKNGIQLPENCGKLIDSNKIEWYGCDSEKHCDEVNNDCSICKYANCNRVQIERDAIIM